MKSDGKGKKRQRQNPKSSNESQLEEILFGKDIVAESISHTAGLEEVEIVVDRKPVDKPAWHDEDDDELQIDIEKSEKRLRKLKSKTNQTKISGADMSSLLQERFQTQPIEWAKDTPVNEEENELSAVLTRTGGILQPHQGAYIDSINGSERYDLLSRAVTPGRISIIPMVNANVEGSSIKPITAVRFHSSTGVMLAAGYDKYMRFFRIDGESNELQLAVKIPDMPISSAHFLGSSSEVVLGGRTRFFYSYDAESGSVQKVKSLYHKGITSYEDMTVSPDGSKIAILGEGGYVHLCSGRNKTWMMDLKMNGTGQSMSFLNDNMIATSGRDADIYVWDIRRTGRCVTRFHHEDGSSTSCLSSSTLNTVGENYLAVGSVSGVTSVFSLSTESLLSSTIGKKTIQPIKSVMNLTEPITSLAFHPSTQILAMSSNKSNNQLKFVHTPSCSVFSNWPTPRTPMKHVTCLEFSPKGAYLAVGNNKGRVLLYRLQDFTNT